MTTLPALSTPCTWNTFLARSTPMVLTCIWTTPSDDSLFNDHPMAHSMPGAGVVYHIILDGENEVSTGCGADDRRGAEKALAGYIARKHKPDWQNSHPAEVALADVLAYYGTTRAPELAHPELVGYHLVPLLKHFGESTCWDINVESCK